MRLFGPTDSLVSLLPPSLNASGRAGSVVSLHLPPVPIQAGRQIRIHLSPFVSFICLPLFHGHACSFQAQKGVFERARALDQSTDSILRTRECPSE